MKQPYGTQNGKNNKEPARAAVGDGYDAPFRGYLNVPMSAELKEEWRVWSETTEWVDVLSREVENGVAVSVKIDARGNGYIASGTQRAANSPNSGLCVTARGGEPGVALSRLLFCLAYLGKADRWEDVQSVADPDRW